MACAISPRSLIVRACIASASINLDPPSRSIMRLFSNCATALVLPDLGSPYNIKYWGLVETAGTLVVGSTNPMTYSS